MNLLTGLLVFSPFTAPIIGLYAIYLVIRKRLTITFNYWTIGLLTLFIWSLIVSLLNKSLLSFGGSFLLLIYFFAAQLSSSIIQNKQSLHSWMDKIINFTSIAAIIGICEKIIFAMLGYGTHRIFSTFGNPNMTGSWFATIILLSGYMLSQEDCIKLRPKYIISILLMSIALTLTGSRGSYVALAATVVGVSLLKILTGNKKFIAIIGICLLLLGGACLLESTAIDTYITAHPIEDSINPRVKIWKDGIAMIKEKPLVGWGLLATYEHGSDLLLNYKQATVHVHNLWLMFLSTLGIVGLSIYGYMKLRFFKDLFKIKNYNTNLMLLFLGINLIVIVQGIVDVSLFAPQIGILFAITGNSVSLLSTANTPIIDNIVISRIHTYRNKNAKIVG